MYLILFIFISIFIKKNITKEEKYKKNIRFFLYFSHLNNRLRNKSMHQFPKIFLILITSYKRVLLDNSDESCYHNLQEMQDKFY